MRLSKENMNLKPNAIISHIIFRVPYPKSEQTEPPLVFKGCLSVCHMALYFAL